MRSEGRFVNDAKRQVEDSYTWNALSETLTVTTSANLFNYVLGGLSVQTNTPNRMTVLLNDETSNRVINYVYNGK